jgi:hypothetical protein
VTGVTVVGVRGHLIAVEAHIGRGLPSLTLTGLSGAGRPGRYRHGFSRRQTFARATTSRRSLERLGPLFTQGRERRQIAMYIAVGLPVILCCSPWLCSS